MSQRSISMNRLRRPLLIALSLRWWCLITVLPVTAFCMPEDCRTLTQYRDTQLFSEWSQISLKRALVVARTKDVEALKREINDSNWWTLSSIPDIAITVKTTADVIIGLISTVSPNGKVIELAQSIGEGASRRAGIARRV